MYNTLFGGEPATAVLYTSRPAAGAVTGKAELIAVSATRGGRNPLLLKFTSNPAEASGVLLSELMPTWAKRCTAINCIVIIMLKRICFFIGLRFWGYKDISFIVKKQRVTLLMD